MQIAHQYKNGSSTDYSKPGARDSAIAAGGAAAWRVRCGAPEHEIACLATRWSEYQAQPARVNAALDVAKVLLEHFDGETKITPKIVKFPLAFSKSFDNLLAPGAFHSIRSAGVGVVSQPLVNRHIVDVQLLDHSDATANPDADGGLALTPSTAPDGAPSLRSPVLVHIVAPEGHRHPDESSPVLVWIDTSSPQP